MYKLSISYFIEISLLSTFPWPPTPLLLMPFEVPLILWSVMVNIFANFNSYKMT